MENPLVSVIIPLYNGKSTIRRAVDSVLLQSYRNFEIIVVDDGSNDGCHKIVEEMGKNDGRIRLFRLPHSNANVARNYGINQSRGEYIAMLDADDEWMESHLEESLCALNDAKVDGIYGSIILRGKTDRLIETRAIRQDETAIDFLLSNGYAAQTSTLFVTASSMKDILWDETLSRHQDYDFIVRYLRKYRMSPKVRATTVYHVSHAKADIDFNSCMRFIKTVEDEISDYIYTDYHKHMLKLALSLSADDKIIRHYRKESTYYTYLLSFWEYMTLLHPQGQYEFLILKLKYVYRILQVRLSC